MYTLSWKLIDFYFLLFTQHHSVIIIFVAKKKEREKRREEREESVSFPGTGRQSFGVSAGLEMIWED